ncbi:MAG: 50S ribosomal protein L29 [Coleofasciculaceae cyanobacterium SM2_1_6]|nr:50S ribosomal protein L29 [Coleofasciculaceae cyanobacterium SM2_1_6]
MPLTKITDARKLGQEELAAEILAAKKQLFELRFKKATQAEVKPHQFKQLRHKIAQMLTVEGERARVEKAEAASQAKQAKQASQVEATETK